MDTLTDIFSYVCGQRACLVADGQVLCVCRRCMGLYVGAAATGLWLAGSGIWRRGLPSWGVFLVNEVTILAAMLGGLHVWDGPTVWRLTCGLWTGHVAMLWLVGGAGHLWRASSREPTPQVPWRRRDKAQALAMPLLLAGAAFAIPPGMALGAGVWTAAIVAGALGLLASVLAAAAALTAYLLAQVRRDAPEPGGQAGAGPQGRARSRAAR